MTTARSHAGWAALEMLLLTVCLSDSLSASCHNGCPCSPSDLPNSCDVAGWCIDRDSIEKKEIKTITDGSSQKRLYAKFSITYLPAECEGQPKLRPYDRERVELYITGKSNPGNLGSYNRDDPTRSDLNLEDVLAGPIVASIVPEESTPGTLVLETPDEGILLSSILPVPAGKKKYLDIVLWHPLDEERPTGRQEFEVATSTGKFVLELGPRTSWSIGISESYQFQFDYRYFGEQVHPDGSVTRKYPITYITNWNRQTNKWDIYHGTDTRKFLSKPTEASSYIFDAQRVKLEIEVNADATVDFGIDMSTTGERWVGWKFHKGNEEITDAGQLNQISSETFHIPGFPGYGWYDYWPTDLATIVPNLGGNSHICPFPPCAESPYLPYSVDYFNGTGGGTSEWTHRDPAFFPPGVTPLIPRGSINPVNSFPTGAAFGRRIRMPAHNLRIEAQFEAKHLLTLGTLSRLDWASFNPYQTTPIPGVIKASSAEIGYCNEAGKLTISTITINCAKLFAGDRVQVSTVPLPHLMVDQWSVPNANAFAPQTEWENLCGSWVNFEMPAEPTTVSFSTRKKRHVTVQGGVVHPPTSIFYGQFGVLGDYYPLPANALITDHPQPGCNRYGGKDEGYFLGGQLVLFMSSAPFPAGPNQVWTPVNGENGGWHASPATSYRRSTWTSPYRERFTIDYIWMPDADTNFCYPWELRDTWGWGEVIFRMNCGGAKIPDPSGAQAMALAFSAETVHSVQSFTSESSLTSVGVSVVLEEWTAANSTVKSKAYPCTNLSYTFGKGFDQIIGAETNYQIQFTQPAENPVLYYLHNGVDWMRVEGQIYENGILRACVSSAGAYQIFGSLKSPAHRPGTSPFEISADIGEAYIYPNPSEKGSLSKLRVETDHSDFATTRIYDPAGDLVHEEALTEIFSGSGGRKIYELVLPLLRFKSGSYIGVVTVGKIAGGPIRKKYTFAVVK